MWPWRKLAGRWRRRSARSSASTSAGRNWRRSAAPDRAGLPSPLGGEGPGVRGPRGGRGGRGGGAGPVPARPSPPPGGEGGGGGGGCLSRVGASAKRQARAHPRERGGRRKEWGEEARLASNSSTKARLEA